MKEKLVSLFIGVLIGVVLSSGYHYIFKQKNNGFGDGRGPRPEMFRERGEIGSGSMRDFPGGGEGDMRGFSGNLRGRGGEIGSGSIVEKSGSGDTMENSGGLEN